jgi:CDP-diacylglycerol--glycerol-3-phosphate 3-phosphatidyltransferase
MTERSLLAMLTFALAAATDLLDGWVARKRGEVSDLGKLLDPVADKALQISILVILAQTGRTPLWLVLLLVVKEVAMVLGGLLFLTRGTVVSARRSGKVASAILFPALAISLVNATIGRPLVFIGVTASLLAGTDYLIQAVRSSSSKRIAGSN